MAKYSISYTRTDHSIGIELVEATSDAEAKIRFLNLSWVAFQPISINSLALAANQPEAAKVVDQSAFVDRQKLRPGAPVEMSPKFVAVPNLPRRMGKKAISDIADRAAAGPKPPSGAVKRQVARAVDRAANPRPKARSSQADIRARAAGLKPFDWREQVDGLSDRISALADEAQALTRAGKDAAADALRAKAKTLAAQRAEITKRNREK